jgi:CBS domain-containing protein
MLIEQIYNPKPHVIPDHTTIAQAIDMMEEDLHNGYIVLDGKGRVVGVLTIQDIAVAIVPYQFRKNIALASGMYKKGFFHEMCASIKDKQVKEVMRRNFSEVSLQDNIMVVITDFLENDLYLVPVIEAGELVGIVTRTEIKKALAEGMGVNSKE